MSKRTNQQRLLKAVFWCALPFVLAALIKMASLWLTPPGERPMNFPAAVQAERLLTDPFLQLPTANSVRVVWFTEFAGRDHWVEYGKDLDRRAMTKTRQLSRSREDSQSNIPFAPNAPRFRQIWRHEAVVTGLKLGEKLPYRVHSVDDDDTEIWSAVFQLGTQPQPGVPLKILLTSDHQQMPRTPTNLQKVVETVGSVDGVFLAGDLVNIPDRASEWFDDQRGNAFFPCLQGRANYELVPAEGATATVYRGGPIIQNAPLFPAIGNHEVMGRFNMKTPLNDQFSDPIPRSVAAERYGFRAEQVNPTRDPAIADAWIKANSFNSDTYEEIFSLPQSETGGSRYYATTFGDIRLVVLYVTNIWRVPSLDGKQFGRYREAEAALNNPEEWGYGQHIFEPIAPGSEQYQWLVEELQSPEFQQAKYKMVMFHHPAHTLGDNIVPAYTNPRAITERDATGKVTAVRYEYPLDEDYIHRDLEPLFNEAGVHLVYYGHSHLWNRFRNASGVNFLESSNVGNTYGAYLGDKLRPVPQGYKEKYVAAGDPNGLEPIMPTIAPITDDNGQPIPYIASNDLTVFSIFDTSTGMVQSYRFDTRDPDGEVVLFDEFPLIAERAN